MNALVDCFEISTMGQHGVSANFSNVKGFVYVEIIQIQTIYTKCIVFFDVPIIYFQFTQQHFKRFNSYSLATPAFQMLLCFNGLCFATVNENIFWSHCLKHSWLNVHETCEWSDAIVFTLRPLQIVSVKYILN